LTISPVDSPTTEMLDNLSYYYDTGPFGLATLCALGATTTHTLRYQDSMLLAAGSMKPVVFSELVY